MARPQWTEQQVFDQMFSGLLWPDSTVTYSFPVISSQLHFDQGEGAGFSPLNGQQQELIRLALATWGDLIPVSFVPGIAGNTDLEFGNSNTVVEFAHAYYPTIGSVWFSSEFQNLQNPALGEYGFHTFVHEIGHALGLNHMGDYNGDDDDGPSSYQDSTMLSVMSYYGPNMQRGMDDVAWASWVASDGHVYSPQTPMMNDIMVIQEMYGEAVTRADNSIYGFGSNVTGATASIYDFSVNLNPILTIYDSGGIDTLDLSGWGSDSAVDLRDGHFTSANGMTNNIAIARDVMIENAITGAGHDTFHGNAADNFLDGGAGYDRAFFTGVFSDYLLDFDLGTGVYTVQDQTGVDGTDTLVDIEYAGFQNHGDDLNNLTSGVHRFFNTQNGNHFFTSNNDEAIVVAQMEIFQYEGQAFARNVMDESNSIGIHRFFNDINGSHFYTANAVEAETVREMGGAFRYEGVAYQAFREKTEGTTELYRFFNKESGAHFYTSNTDEMEHVKLELAGSYQFEGVAYYVAA